MKNSEKRQLHKEALQKSFSYLATTFGISEPASEFQLLDYVKDELDMRHFRLQQVYLKDNQRGGSQVFDAQNKEPGRFQSVGKAVTNKTQDWGSSNPSAVSAAYNTGLVWDFLKDAPGVAGDALRYMDHPSKDAIKDQSGHVIQYIPDPTGRGNDKVVRFGDPEYNSPKIFSLQSIDHASQYKDGMDVHFSSGLVNNAFYVLAEGGKNDTSQLSVTGIGRDDALKVYYRALTTYMVPNTDFAAARAATLKAATDIFGAGSPQVQGVKDSWYAVGVG